MKTTTNEPVLIYYCNIYNNVYSLDTTTIIDLNTPYIEATKEMPIQVDLSHYKKVLRVPNYTILTLKAKYQNQSN